MENKIEVNDRHLYFLQSGALDLSASLYDEFFTAVEAKLLDLADHARNNEQQWNIFSLARDVKISNLP